jgi:hypothetical protein
MSFAAEHVIATFAASIVIARGTTSVTDIREAWSDARWILFPDPADADYRAWRDAHGETPLTLQQAQAATDALISRKKQMLHASQGFSTI